MQILLNIYRYTCKCICMHELSRLTFTQIPPSSLHRTHTHTHTEHREEEDQRVEKRGSHIPFRDSKLTRLLQDSLGGNAKTVLILAIASSKLHQQESINTLKFGERARQLTTKPTANTGTCVGVGVGAKSVGGCIPDIPQTHPPPPPPPRPPRPTPHTHSHKSQT